MLRRSIYSFYQRTLVEPAARWIGQRITPFYITFLSGIFGLLVIPAIIWEYKFIAIVLLLASGYCDTLDGVLARVQQKITPIGTTLDLMTDRAVEFSAILGLYLVNPATRALAAIFMLGSILLSITSFLVVGIFTPNTSEKSFYYSPGLIERTEVFIFFMVMILLPQYFNPLALLFTLLVCLTAVIRLIQFIQAQPKENP